MHPNNPAGLRAGDIVRQRDVPGILIRLTEVQCDAWGCFHVITKSGRRNRRWTGWSGPLHLYELVKREE